MRQGSRLRDGLAGKGGAIVLALTATAVFSVMHALVRHVGGELHPFEIAFFRNLLGFVAVLPLVVRGGRQVLVRRGTALELPQNL